MNGDDLLTRVEDVAEVLREVTDERFAGTAAEWARNDIRMKELAISHEELEADADEDIELDGFVYMQLEQDYLIKSGIEKLS